jgi:UDP-N-acetylglucosamine 2-epimerase
LDADADLNSILQAVGRARTPEFRESLSGMINPYGEGRASETIVGVLTTVPLSQTLLMKRHSEQ